ncbi:hypothetical protein CA267_001925 [Alteromonas pelagimontana]|uniref:Uncharacterized protein n=1 Tax=Alteromonas pelagimontana TaxID=1858656 RepID=A0A6M4M8Z3_9ALTE|nr:hypothetical protein [Alteromonas pelagimontana]QJR79642.1 hypothetical protein CA267_001925 [Alteromonas pelagimontana]
MLTIFEVLTLTAAFIVFGWVIIAHCRIENVEVEKEIPDNVIPFGIGKTKRLEENLHLFLQADQALADEQHERYMALYMQATSSAKELLRDRVVERKTG